MIPYIGMTDFRNAKQVRQMLEAFRANCSGLRQPKKMMVGVMMSRKTLWGLPSKFELAFPHNSEVSGIFINDPLVFNALHYADYEGVDVLESLEMAISLAEPNIHALQLDMIWPDPEIVRDYHRIYPDLKIILQVGSSAFDYVSSNPRELIVKLKEYNHGDHSALSAVLLDRSMGQGKGMDASLLRPYLSAIKDWQPDLALAVAGGLGPDTLHLVEPLIPEFPDLSIDAQGRLRPSGSFLDPIDWSMADKYVRSALEMYKRCCS